MGHVVRVGVDREILFTGTRALDERYIEARGRFNRQQAVKFGCKIWSAEQRIDLETFSWMDAIVTYDCWYANICTTTT